VLFSVIYSVDVCADDNVLAYAPPQVEELWDQTEGDEEFGYAYLEGCWEGGHHAKWCSILNREQFDEFIDRCNLVAEDVQTMGSLGTPGCGFGWAPAISFASSDPDAIQSCYVTPLPQVEKDGYDERDWERLRGAVLAVYG